jgi:hypothetical protein
MRVLLAALSGLIAGIAITNSAAQNTALDPARVAPHIFEQVFENDRVRVLRVNERHGETAPLHSLRDRVVMHVNPCAWVEVQDDGSEKMYSYRPGDVYWRDATTRGGKTSNVIQQCHSLFVELKQPPAY